MKLSKSCKAVLDAAIAGDEDFYTVPEMAAKAGLSLRETKAICESLADGRFIRWADRQRYTFALNDTGLSYKEYDHLEKLEIWKNRIWGFVTGLVSGVLLAWIIRLLAL